MNQILSDFSKLQCPFIRQTFEVNKDHFRKYGPHYQMRGPEVYLVVNIINPGFEWVFEDENTFAVEKLDGTNVKVLTKNKNIVAIQNRKNVVDPLKMSGAHIYIMEGIYRAIQLGFLQPDGEQAGEVIGTKFQGNPYKIDGHIWYSFQTAIERLKYNSFEKYDKSFENWSSWFKEGLLSRFYSKKAAKEGKADSIFAEGVVFYNLKRKNLKQTWRAKLRRDMFDWYYDGVEIFDYNAAGRDDIEDQEKFD